MVDHYCSRGRLFYDFLAFSRGIVSSISHESSAIMRPYKEILSVAAAADPLADSGEETPPVERDRPESFL